VRYIDGDTSATVSPWPGPLWSDELLIEAGKTVADYHRAVADFVPPKTFIGSTDHEHSCQERSFVIMTSPRTTLSFEVLNF